MWPRTRTLSDKGIDRSRSRSNSRVNTNRDCVRCYRCREYDHFMAECPNTPTDEEHSVDVEPASLQMLTQEGIPINSNGEVECLNLWKARMAPPHFCQLIARQVEK